MCQRFLIKRCIVQASESGGEVCKQKILKRYTPKGGEREIMVTPDGDYQISEETGEVDEAVFRNGKIYLILGDNLG